MQPTVRSRACVQRPSASYATAPTPHFLPRRKEKKTVARPQKQERRHYDTIIAYYCCHQLGTPTSQLKNRRPPTPPPLIFVQGLHQPETSSRTPSPIYRRQAQPRSPPSPPAAIARAAERPATTRAWKSPEDGLAPGVGESHRGGDWASRGQHTPGTAGKQILQRYLAHLNPKVKERKRARKHL